MDVNMYTYIHTDPLLLKAAVPLIYILYTHIYIHIHKIYTYIQTLDIVEVVTYEGGSM